MNRLPLGLILLVVVSILVYFGLAQRLLDRMRLSDKTALGVIAALIVGSFIDIPLGQEVSINVGGALVPIGLAIYLLMKAGTTKEWVRSLLAAGATTAVIYVLGSYIMTGEPSGRGLFLDPLYIYPLVGGTVAYLLGRSRRGAFVAGSLGVLGLDIVHWVWLSVTRTPGTVNIGGAGAFDSIVVAGLVAVMLAEIVGETRERLQGGPESEGRDPDLIKNLKPMDKNEKMDGEDK
ncbi:MAG: hypothetical protein CVU87_04115 [Firmicutes bacterium HGW-Firmicutes-12]|jgi:uncharacterized membrane protein|nr:MAG: hypothetical protein CVU87_04115 [Firmicutes bacterium HGW-Firmicutes-12]